MERKKLPISEASFEVIRNNNEYYYVDKTSFVYKLAKKPWPPRVLTRPRRFGKSLFLDTIKCLYEGKKELFDGLYIYDKWDWSKTHPVIKLDFSSFGSTSNVDFRADIFDTFNELGRQIDYVRSSEGSPGGYLGGIIKRLYATEGKKVVVLIDEYDAPVLNSVSEPNEYKKTHEDMRGVLRSLKANSNYIESIMMTGILKLDHHDFFSAANIFVDITMDPEFNDVCGYTEDELCQTFKPEFVRKDLHAMINMDTLKIWYDGYRWGAPSHLYNPNDILFTFDNNRISDWWTRFGLSARAIEHIKNTPDFSFENYTASTTLDDLEQGLNVSDVYIPKTLFQTGYLTIKSEATDSLGGVEYELGVPNREVKSALARLRLFLRYGFVVKDRKETLSIRTALVSCQFDRLKVYIRSILAKLTYDEGPEDLQEKHFSLFMQSIFRTLAVEDILTEVHTQEGRTDMVIKDSGKYFVMEFKLLDAKGVRRGDAMKQLKERNYGARYKEDGPVYLLGFEFTTSGIGCDPKDAKVTLAYLDHEKYSS